MILRDLDSLTTPTIRTERLVLRAHRISDLEGSVAMWSDPAVSRYTIGDPSPPQRTWLRLLSYRGHWDLMHFGYWAVEEQSSGDFVGELGIANFKRDNEPLIAGIPEVGWALRPQVHGQGYATEALKAVLAWADAQPGLAQTVCLINRDNVRSLRVAEKIGFTTKLLDSTEEHPSAIFVRNSTDR